MGFFGKYLSDNGAKNLSHYRYKGSDDSLLLKHVLSHIHCRILPLIPEWVAPNLITVTGFLQVFAVHLVQARYSPDMTESQPNWLYFLAAVSMFIYQTLDALDGKQARRTGSSSALGLLFDHGCDALTTTVIALMICTGLQLGPTGYTATLWSGMAFTFFAATWEEYYTGELHLPIINGPNEGIATAYVLLFLTGLINDPADPFWLRESIIPGLRNNMIIYYGLNTASVCTSLYNVYTVLHAVRAQAAQQNISPASVSGSVGRNTFLVAATRTGPLVVMIALALCWLEYSPTNVMLRHHRVVLWTLGLLLAKLLSGLMLAHLCEEEYHPLTKTMAVIAALSVHAVFSALSHDAHFGSIEQRKLQWFEDQLLYSFFAVAVVSYSHMVLMVIREVSGALNISVFSITSKLAKTKAQ